MDWEGDREGRPIRTNVRVLARANERRGGQVDRKGQPYYTPVALMHVFRVMWYIWTSLCGGTTGYTKKNK